MGGLEFVLKENTGLESPFYVPSFKTLCQVGLVQLCTILVVSVENFYSLSPYLTLLQFCQMVWYYYYGGYFQYIVIVIRTLILYCYIVLPYIIS